MLFVFNTMTSFVNSRDPRLFDFLSKLHDAEEDQTQQKGPYEEEGRRRGYQREGDRLLLDFMERSSTPTSSAVSFWHPEESVTARDTS